MAKPHMLVLDSDVRDWVFIPLTLVIVLMQLVMQSVHVVRWMPPPSSEARLRQRAPAQRAALRARAWDERGQ